MALPEEIQIAARECNITAVRAWLAMKIDWKSHYPELENAPSKLHIIDHLFHLNLGNVIGIYQKRIKI